MFTIPCDSERSHEELCTSVVFHSISLYLDVIHVQILNQHTQTVLLVSTISVLKHSFKCEP